MPKVRHAVARWLHGLANGIDNQVVWYGGTPEANPYPQMPADAMARILVYGLVIGALVLAGFALTCAGS